MSEYNSLPPFRRNSADDLAGELYPDIFSLPPYPIKPTSTERLVNQDSVASPWWSLSSTDSFPGQYSMAPSSSLSSTDSFPGQYSMAPSSSLSSISKPGTIETAPPASTSMPVQDVTTTQSLIAALQSTMTTTTKAPVVIPGTKKRERDTDKIATAQAERHLHPHLRLGIILLILLVILLITLFSLSPLSSGQSNLPIIGSVVDWVHVQQQSLNNIVGRTLTGTQDNKAAPAAADLPQMNLPRSQYVAIARQDAIDAGIPPDYFVRQINLESGFNPGAISPAGAVGIAQFLPGTARGLGVNPYDPVSALRGAARYMANYANQYGGDYAKALAAYNAGSGTVDYAVRVGGANWRSYLPGETQNYIHTIMGI